MIEAVGDLWKHPARFKVVPINWTLNKRGALVMGAGVAKQAADRYPELPYDLGKFVRMRTRDSLGPTPVFVARYNVIALPTKTDWRFRSELPFVEKMIQLLAESVFCTPPGPHREVVMPRPGCGLGGLRWEEDVKPICERYLVGDHYIVIDKE